MTSVHNDPIGQAVYDYHFNLIDQPIIVHSEDFEDDFIEPSYLFRSYDEMPPLEKKAMELCLGKVLDIGACAGTHSIYLQKSGYDVTAIESSALCCKVLNERGVKKVINQDIFHFEDQKFDTIILLMNGSGIAGNLDGLYRLFEKLKRLLTAKGQILIDSSDLMYLYIDNNQATATLNLNSEKYYGELTYQTEYKSYLSEVFQWLFVDKDHLTYIAEQCHLKVAELFNGDHYDFLARLTN